MDTQEGEGEVSAYVGRNKNLKDLKDDQRTTCPAIEVQRSASQGTRMVMSVLLAGCSTGSLMSMRGTPVVPGGRPDQRT